MCVAFMHVYWQTTLGEMFRRAEMIGMTVSEDNSSEIRPVMAYGPDVFFQ